MQELVSCVKCWNIRLQAFCIVFAVMNMRFNMFINRLGFICISKNSWWVNPFLCCCSGAMLALSLSLSLSLMPTCAVSFQCLLLLMSFSNLLLFLLLYLFCCSIWYLYIFHALFLFELLSTQIFLNYFGKVGEITNALLE